MATTRVEIEEIATTKSEKFLAVVLAVFMLIGGVWAYVKIDDGVRDVVRPEAASSPADAAAIERHERAYARLAAAEEARVATRDDLELRREAYRTALDAGRPADDLERAYRAAAESFARAERDVAAAQAVVRAAEPAASAARARVASAYDERANRQAIGTVVLRALFVAAALVLGYWLLARLRRAGSRYLPVAFSLLGAATVLAFVLAGDYVSDYVDPLDLGPLVLSLFGIAITLAAFWTLQRYLARRLPFRRVRKQECPFCGYPAGGTPHCEGCGRDVIASCSTCGEGRRVGTLHCGACGHA